MYSSSAQDGSMPARSWNCGRIWSKAEPLGRNSWVGSLSWVAGKAKGDGVLAQNFLPMSGVEGRRADKVS